MTDIATMELTQEQLQRSAGRLQRLRDLLATEGHTAMIIDHEIDIWYLTGFVGHDATLIVGPSVAAIFCDARYEEYLAPWKQGGVHEVLIGPRHELASRIKSVAHEHELSTFAFQPEHLSVSKLQQWRTDLQDLDLVASADHIAALRMIKDDHEVSLIEQCISIQDAGLAAAFEGRTSGMTEAQFTALLEYEMRQRGADGASFEPIIATGSNSSVIHHMPGDKPIEHGMLLVDWGARIDGYCSDLTRTFSIGPMDHEMERIYDIVLEAQLAAIAACCPGADCSEVDEAARSVIAEAGYAEYFPHGLGHGLGMLVHESPNFSTRGQGILLQEGMVMTVEPGIYLPGRGGVRIEDDVLITRDGHRVLSNLDKHREAAIL
jgi:Xaa-Pro aminopeptidase